MTDTLATLRAELDALKEAHAADRAAGQATAQALAALAEQVRGESDKAHRVARQLVELERKVAQGEEGLQGFRLMLKALAKQIEWEADNNRKLLEAALGLAR